MRNPWRGNGGTQAVYRAKETSSPLTPAEPLHRGLSLPQEAGTTKTEVVWVSAKVLRPLTHSPGFSWSEQPRFKGLRLAGRVRDGWVNQDRGDLC